MGDAVNILTFDLDALNSRRREEIRLMEEEKLRLEELTAARFAAQSIDVRAGASAARGGRTFGPGAFERQQREAEFEFEHGTRENPRVVVEIDGKQIGSALADDMFAAL